MRMPARRSTWSTFVRFSGFHSVPTGVSVWLRTSKTQYQLTPALSFGKVLSHSGPFENAVAEYYFWNVS